MEQFCFHSNIEGCYQSISCRSVCLRIVTEDGMDENQNSK